MASELSLSEAEEVEIEFGDRLGFGRKVLSWVRAVYASTFMTGR